MANKTAQAKPGRMVRISQLIDYVGLSRPTIYRLSKAGKFPKPVKIGARASAWDLNEIDAWIEARRQHAPGGAA